MKESILYINQEKTVEEGPVGKKILHDAQILGVLPGRSIFRKKTSEVKVLERDPLKPIQAYAPLRKSVLLSSVYMCPVRRQLLCRGLCSFGGLRIMSSCYVTQSLSLLTPLLYRREVVPWVEKAAYFLHSFLI